MEEKGLNFQPKNSPHYTEGVYCRLQSIQSQPCNSTLSTCIHVRSHISGIAVIKSQEDRWWYWSFHHQLLPGSLDNAIECSDKSNLWWHKLLFLLSSQLYKNAQVVLELMATGEGKQEKRGCERDYNEVRRFYNSFFSILSLDDLCRDVFNL